MDEEVTGKRLKKENTSLSTFRFALENNSQLDDLASSVSKQWEVPVSTQKYYKGVAYLGIERVKLTHKVAMLGNTSVRNLSYSSKVALTLAKRLAFVESTVTGVSKNLTHMDTSIKGMKKVIGKGNPKVDFTHQFKELEEKVTTLSALVRKLQKQLSGTSSPSSSRKKSTKL